MCPLEPQFLRPAQQPALRANLGKQDIELCRRIRQHAGASIADLQHQRRLAVVHRDHWIGCEYQFGPRPREADEGEAGQDRGERDAAHDFGRRDHMPVERRGIHLAITNSRDCLDAEKEGICEAVRPGVGDRTRN